MLALRRPETGDEMILFLDFAGAPFDGNTPKITGLGGSEMAQIQLAEALAEHGHKVHVLVARDTNKELRTINGVGYGHPTGEMGTVKNVILSRMTPLPAGLAGCNKIVSLTDMGPHQVADCDYLVGVSRWQLDRFAAAGAGSTAHRAVIPPIIEKPPALEKVPNRFIYASGAMKGLKETLEAWTEVRPSLPAEAELRVTTAGWDLPEPGTVEAAGAIWLGVLTPAAIREEIAQASGLFYVNTYPETFCAIAALAEAAGTTPYILSKDPAGMAEAITSPIYHTRDTFFKAVINGKKAWPAKNYSKNKVLQRWENILR